MMIKKRFTTGIALLLPIILTVMIVKFLINFLTKPFLNATAAFLTQFDFFQHPFFLFSASTLISFTSKALILLIIIGLILLIGLIGKLFLISYFFRIGDYLFHRVPYINKIYKACQDIVQSIFSSSKKFTQVALVPYPNAYNLSMGLVTGNSIKVGQFPNTQDLVSVFIPGTPNPSVGFLLMYRREQITLIDMKAEDAMKMIVSCGIVMPDFTIIQPQPQFSAPFYEKPI